MGNLYEYHLSYFGCEIIETNSKHRSEDIEKSRCLESKVDKIVKKEREKDGERTKDSTETLCRRSGFWIQDLAYSMNVFFSASAPKEYFCFNVWSFV